MNSTTIFSFYNIDYLYQKCYTLFAFESTIFCPASAELRNFTIRAKLILTYKSIKIEILKNLCDHHEY